MPRFRFEHGDDADTVFQPMTDRDELTKRCESLGERNVRVEVSESGGVTKTQIAREVERDLPGFAKKLFKAKNTLVEREEWHSVNGQYEGKGQLKIVGTGATINSKIRLSPSGAGCVYEINFEVTAKVPLIRKKLEAFIGDTSLESLREQHECYAHRLMEL